MQSTTRPLTVEEMMVPFNMHDESSEHDVDPSELTLLFRAIRDIEIFKIAYVHPEWRFDIINRSLEYASRIFTTQFPLRLPTRVNTMAEAHEAIQRLAGYVGGVRQKYLLGSNGHVVTDAGRAMCKQLLSVDSDSGCFARDFFLANRLNEMLEQKYTGLRMAMMYDDSSHPNWIFRQYALRYQTQDAIIRGNTYIAFNADDTEHDLAPRISRVLADIDAFVERIEFESKN